ncbi:hypothetical protein [Clostridium sp. HBUAS56010]|uniref:hypothetical protein n=1 Tax=Clostridium sp. HBUAS56010 TaxID=2571127 RepID=UPI0011788DE1|nr:hypothetical protein [Clostridium sp. HBUAS56010]
MLINDALKMLYKECQKMEPGSQHYMTFPRFQHMPGINTAGILKMFGEWLPYIWVEGSVLPS